jgi:hypothetical protein
MPIWGWDFSTLDSSSRFFIERPPGVPFQKIQFGNERGGRSVLSRLTAKSVILFFVFSK